MSSKTVCYGTTARTKLLRGAEALSKTVAVTYGPGGRTVLIQRFAGHFSTKDGMTVSQEVSLSDPVENLGCQLLKQACLQVNKECGDGTTSTAILAGALLREGHKRVVAGEHPRDVVNRIEADAAQACSFARVCSRSVNTQADLNRVALIACNGDAEIAEHLSEACMAVGKDGSILIVDGVKTETVLELKEGMEFDRGAVHPNFIALNARDADGAEAGEVVLEGALVAVSSVFLRSIEDVRSMLEESTQWPDNPLLILAPSVEGIALTTLIINYNPKKRVKNLCPVTAPGMPHQKFDNLKDIAALTGATLVDPAAGMNHQKWQPEWFGTVRRATITKDKTLLEAYPEHHEFVEARLVELRREYDRLPSGFEKDQLRARMGKLSGGVAFLRVGGITEAARKERRARIEDALGAVQAALRGGVVPGAGATYSWIADRLPTGCLQTALRSPLQVLLRNAGETSLPPTQQPDWFGWDFVQRVPRDLSQDPMIADPTEVVVAVIRAAVSVATTLLLVETSITLR